MKSDSRSRGGVRGDDSGVDTADQLGECNAFILRERGGVIGGVIGTPGEIVRAEKGVVNEEAYAREKRIR